MKLRDQRTPLKVRQFAKFLTLVLKKFSGDYSVVKMEINSSAWSGGWRCRLFESRSQGHIRYLFHWAMYQKYCCDFSIRGILPVISHAAYPRDFQSLFAAVVCVCVCVWLQFPQCQVDLKAVATWEGWQAGCCLGSHGHFREACPTVTLPFRWTVTVTGILSCPSRSLPCTQPCYWEK